MAKGLSFSAVLKLQKQQFDAGIREVKRSLNDLKSTFTQIAGALGAGLGLASFIGNMKETATQLSVVKATLENVSQSTEEYGESLEFLRRIAKEYGQDQNVLTMSFAKFSAAARGCGIELEQVKSIYESLTRASGAYHLSADQTQSVMLAVEQMFSKGKVSAEELRRQLGNSLPNAFNMMAKAAGDAGITLNGTAAELDKAMRAGQVMASEVMPYFARELDKATQGANFDSLQSSLNRLSNSWYDFVEASDMEGFYNNLVKKGSGALDILTKGFKFLGLTVKDIAVFISSGLGFALLNRKGVVALKEIQKETEVLRERAEKLDAIIFDTELKYVELSMTNAGKKVQMDLNSATAAAAGLNKELVETLLVMEALDGERTHTRTITAAEGMTYLDQRTKELKADLKETNAQLLKNGKDGANAGRMMGTAFLGAKKAAQAFFGTLKAAAGMLVFSLIITALTKIIGKLKEAYDEAKRLKELPENTVKEAEEITEATKGQIKNLQDQVNIVKYYTENEEKRKAALEEINKVLGREEDKLFDLQTPIEEIQNAVNEWGKGVIEGAEALQKWNKLEEVEGKIANLNAELAKIKDNADYGSMQKYWDEFGNYYEGATAAAAELTRQEKQLTKELNAQIAARQALIDAGALQGKPDAGAVKDSTVAEMEGHLDAYKKSADELATQKKNGALTEKEYQKELQKTQTKVFKQISVYEDLGKIVDKLDDKHKKLFNDIKAGFQAGQKGGSGGGGSTKKTPIQQLADTMDGYIEKIAELKNQLKNGVITQDEFDKGVIDIANNTEKSVGAFEDMGKALDTLGAKYKDFFNNVKALKEGAEENLAFEKLFEEAKASIEKSTEDLLDSLEKYFDKADEISRRGMPELKQRDTFFDYKKSDKDINGEKASNMEDYVKDLQEMKDELMELAQSVEGGLDPVMQEFLDKLNEKLKEATKNAKDLRQKANLAELAADVEKFTKAFKEAKFDAIKEVASSFDRLVKSIESVDDAIGELGKSTSEPLDQMKALVAIINEIIQVITTVKSVVEGFNAVQEALSAKRKADNAQMLAMSGAIVASQEAQVAAEAHSATATVAAEGTKQAALAATTTAAAGSAIAGSASSVASIPYVGPILAAAAVASMVALFAANLKKFAGGGIVNGPTAGDRNLVRANGGEMILNKHQQSTLFNMLNGKGGAAGGGNVEFKIRGADLVGAINNYQSRQRGWG